MGVSRLVAVPGHHTETSGGADMFRAASLCFLSTHKQPSRCRHSILQMPKGPPPSGALGSRQGPPGFPLKGSMEAHTSSSLWLFSKWPESRITASVPHVLALLFFSGGLREDDAPPHVLRRYDCITLTDRAECVLRLPVNLSPNKAVGLRRSHRLSADHSCCFFFSGCNCSYSAVIMDFNGSLLTARQPDVRSSPPGRRVGVCVSSEVVLSTR